MRNAIAPRAAPGRSEVEPDPTPRPNRKPIPRCRQALYVPATILQGRHHAGPPRPNPIPAQADAIHHRTAERRTLLSTYTVTNLNDTGAGSLPDAIQQANVNAGADTIDFAPGLSGTISLAPTMPAAPRPISSVRSSRERDAASPALTT